MSKPSKTPLRITPGACVATDRWSDVLLTAGSSVVGEIGRAYTDEDWPEISANAALYCDAHNTYQKDPTLPSELLRQRDEAVRLLGQLEDVKKHIEVVERNEEWSGGMPTYGTPQKFKAIKDIAASARTFLDTLKP